MALSGRSVDGTENLSPLSDFVRQLHEFREFGKATVETAFPEPDVEVPVFVNEFWTSKQRAASPLHEISYRACFKPQLPRFFIERLTEPGEVVYDPFMGRGTTLLESAMLGRVPLGCDINPLSRVLLSPRLNPPEIDEVVKRLEALPLDGKPDEWPEDLLVFYHPETLRELVALRSYFREREAEAGALDPVDDWIRMVATNRLTGHSSGFFSVYTLPPNQATSVASQRKINEKRDQVPPRREVVPIILKKTRNLLNRLAQEDREAIQSVASRARLLTACADDTPEIAEESVALVVTSPPFLDVVDYQRDNWLRCWFNGIDASEISIWQLNREDRWMNAMTGVFQELRRVLKPGGLVAFEVGEVRGGELLMETLVVPAAGKAGLQAEMVVVNDQEFTKTANCWGVDNRKKGTNTNRIILLRKLD